MYYQQLTHFILVSALLLTGCGSNSNTPVDNSTLSSNELGFFGLNAKFGTQALLDRWEASITVHDSNVTLTGEYIFRNDGVFSATVDYFTYGIYGVDTAGKKLFFKGYQSEGSQYSMRLIIERSDACLETELLNNNEDIFATALLCPKQTDNTALISGVNIGEQLNQSGYYGSNVLFGTHLIVGHWKGYNIEDNGSISSLPYINMQFLDDGTVVKNTETGVPETAIYGVNEDATKLHISTPPLSIAKSLNETCYKVSIPLHDNIESFMAFCKTN